MHLQCVAVITPFTGLLLMQNEVVRRSLWVKTVYPNSRVMLTPAINHRASSAEKGLPLWPIPDLSWSCHSPSSPVAHYHPQGPWFSGPGVGSVATTAIMANMPTFPWTLEEVWRCLLCPWKRAIGAWRLKDKEGDRGRYIFIVTFPYGQPLTR